MHSRWGTALHAARIRLQSGQQRFRATTIYEVVSPDNEP